MFDIGFFEIVIVAVVALLVVGPERLPKLAYEVGLWVGKLQRFIRSARVTIENEIHQYEVKQAITDQKKEFDELKKLIDDTRQEIDEQLGAVAATQNKVEEIESEKPTKPTAD